MSEANAEVVPLLKRVISLLQEKGISLSGAWLPTGYPTGGSAVAEERYGREMVNLQKIESNRQASTIYPEGKT